MFNTVHYYKLYLPFSVALAVSTTVHDTSGLFVNFTQTVESNTMVVIVCNIDVEFPSWSGPPLSAQGSLTRYNFHDYSDFLQNLDKDKLQRMSWANNNRDLVFNPVTRNDDGEYYCNNIAQHWRVELFVRCILMFFIICVCFVYFSLRFLT